MASTFGAGVAFVEPEVLRLSREKITADHQGEARRQAYSITCTTCCAVRRTPARQGRSRSSPRPA